VRLSALSFASSHWVFVMALRLANQNDCRFFKFWLDNQIREGVCCQGEMFLSLQTFSPKQRDQAYEVAAHLGERTTMAVIICSKDRYVVAVDLHSRIWENKNEITPVEPEIVRKLRATLRQHASNLNQS
jgi:hypothetical protein